MATLDTSLIRRELKSIASASSAIKSQLRSAMDQLERSPGSFPELDTIHPRIRKQFPSVTLRKIKLVSGKHNFRVIVAHWDRGEHEDHVDGLYAFARQDGYPIEWDYLTELLDDPDE